MQALDHEKFLRDHIQLLNIQITMNVSNSNLSAATISVLQSQSILNTAPVGNTPLLSIVHASHSGSVSQPMQN